MAAAFDAGGDYLTYATPFDYNAPYTFSAWIRPNAAVAGQGIFAVHYNAGTVWHNMDDFYFTAANKFNTRAYIGGVTNGDGTDSGTWANGTYYHVAIVRGSATSLSFIQNGTTIDTDTTDVTGRTAADRLILGNGWSTATLHMRGQIAHAKFWTAALTNAEVLNESRSIRPVRLANLWAWYPMLAGATERLRDYSGNGRTLTNAGTLTDEVDPGISWGASPIYVDNGAYTPPATTSDPLNLYRRGLRRYFVGA